MQRERAAAFAAFTWTLALLVGLQPWTARQQPPPPWALLLAFPSPTTNHPNTQPPNHPPPPSTLPAELCI